MRGLSMVIAAAAVGCSGIQEGEVHWPDPGPDAVAEAGGPDGYADQSPWLDAPGSDDLAIGDSVAPDEGRDPSGDGVPEDAPDAPDAPDTVTPTGLLRHLGWFGPGGVVTGNGVSGLGFLSGPQQAWQVQ